MSSSSAVNGTDEERQPLWDGRPRGEEGKAATDASGRRRWERRRSEHRRCRPEIHLTVREGYGERWEEQWWNLPPLSL